MAMFTRRLTRKPVQHTCGHFEARLMSFEIDPTLGYATAGNACAQCSPNDGRGSNPNYPTLAAVEAACVAQDAAEGRR